MLKDIVMSRKGFTLIELVVAVLIIGILAAIAVPRYIRVVEKSRAAEAKNILGLIRAAQVSYGLEIDFYTTDIPSLSLDVPTGGCVPGYYFTYSITDADFTAGTFTTRADRCTAGGKSPASIIPYFITIDQDGSYGGDTDFI